ncbi:MAG: hypothetical protein Q9169_000299 [Polycauliona sp. 2 TL-2023]
MNSTLGEKKIDSPISQVPTRPTYSSPRIVTALTLLLTTHSPSFDGPVSHPPSQLNTVWTVFVVYVTSLEYRLGQGVRVAGHDVRVDVRVMGMAEMIVVVVIGGPIPGPDNGDEEAAPEEENEEIMDPDDEKIMGIDKLVVPPDKDRGTPVDDEEVTADVKSIAPVADGVSSGKVYSVGSEMYEGISQAPGGHSVDKGVSKAVISVRGGRGDVGGMEEGTLCLGLNTGTSVGTLVGIALKVAEEGAMGPFRRAELKMVLLGAGSNGCLPPKALSCSSTFAQVKIAYGSAK